MSKLLKPSRRIQKTKSGGREGRGMGAYLDCCDREAIGWVVSPTDYNGDDVRDLMLDSVEKRFGDQLPSKPMQWLSDDGSAYLAEQTRVLHGKSACSLLRRLSAAPGVTEWSGFVKAFKRGYVARIPRPNRATAILNLAIAFEHYNKQYAHRALKHRSPR